ncbi:MAG: DNA primase [Candidatus Dojkabacteria bacterium]|nr:MAG: DNA primase [Candidatus Dojkabacteria bacterium]
MDNRDTIELVKSKADIVAVVERYVKLRQMGKNYGAPCPFHQEKTPSFMVSPDLQHYKCFGCGESGDVISFVQKIENIEFFEALQKLAKEVGVEITTHQKNSKYAKLEELNEIATQFYQQQLESVNGKKAKEYFVKRGLDHSEAKKFQVGYAYGRDTLLGKLRASKYSNADLAASGLFTDKSGRLKDRFINRLMFPIKSSTGKVIAFSGRQLPGDDFGPKYLNSPETAIFHKRETVFGIFESKNYMRKEDLCVMVEGQMDVISAHKIGLNYCVAPLGTGLTLQQLELISRYTKNILFFFDNDTAGHKAVERGFELASPLGLNLFAMIAPKPYKDIDEFIQSEPEKVVKLVKPKVDAFTFLISQQLSRLDTTGLKGREEFISYCEGLLTFVTDKRKGEYYRQKVKKLSGISVDGSAENVKPADDAPQAATGKVEQSVLSREEYLVSQALVQKFDESFRKMDKKYFTKPALKELIELIQGSLEADADLDVKAIYESDETPAEVVAELERIYFSPELASARLVDKQELNNIYRLVRIGYYERVRNHYRKQQAIAEEAGDTNTADRFTDKIIQVTSNIRELEEWQKNSTPKKK